MRICINICLRMFSWQHRLNTILFWTPRSYHCFILKAKHCRFNFSVFLHSELKRRFWFFLSCCSKDGEFFLQNFFASRRLVKKLSHVIFRPDFWSLFPYREQLFYLDWLIEKQYCFSLNLFAFFKHKKNLEQTLSKFWCCIYLVWKVYIAKKDICLHMCCSSIVLQGSGMFASGRYDSQVSKISLTSWSLSEGIFLL